MRNIFQSKRTEVNGRYDHDARPQEGRYRDDPRPYAAVTHHHAIDGIYTQKEREEQEDDDEDAVTEAVRRLHVLVVLLVVHVHVEGHEHDDTQDDVADQRDHRGPRQTHEAVGVDESAQ